jgi:hypothetical protein
MSRFVPAAFIRISSLVIFGLAFAGPGQAQDPLPGHTVHPQPAAAQGAPGAPECYCLAAGRRFALGDTVCLRTGEAPPRLAECQMVINVMSWRVTERPCPEA